MRSVAWISFLLGSGITFFLARLYLCPCDPYLRKKGPPEVPSYFMLRQARHWSEPDHGDPTRIGDAASAILFGGSLPEWVENIIIVEENDLYYVLFCERGNGAEQPRGIGPWIRDAKQEGVYLKKEDLREATPSGKPYARSHGDSCE